MYCKICGNKVADNDLFCNNCGNAINRPDIGIYGRPSEKRHGILAVIIVLLVIIVALISVIVGYMIYPNKKDSSDAVEATAAAMVVATELTEQSTDVPIVTEEPVINYPEPQNEAVISSRADLYNSSLTYKRMSGIHNTVLTDDATFFELKAVIEAFDAQCEAYMNEITDAVPYYLEPGSTAYNQQVKYKQNHPFLDQVYQKVDVINARQGGGYYYVWDTEVMSVVENGQSKTVTDHWVYKLKRTNGRWYICDYTQDPAF